MNNIFKILCGIGFLIAIFLFLSNGNVTVKVINTIATNMLNGIQILQGRDSKIQG